MVVIVITMIATNVTMAMLVMAVMVVMLAVIVLIVSIAIIVISMIIAIEHTFHQHENRALLSMCFIAWDSSQRRHGFTRQVDGSGLYADIVAPSFHGTGRHFFVDVAVAEPASLSMVKGGASATNTASCAGFAAAAKAKDKCSRYRDACAQTGTSFRDGGIERYGACSDGLVGFLRLIAGETELDPAEAQY